MQRRRWPAPPVLDTPIDFAKPADRRWVIVWGALFLLLGLLMVAIGLEAALHFTGPAIDGPFQLYNALRRIAAGQQAGVDFQFFHGIGIPYLHYLPFRFFGATFVASEVTRELTSALLYPFVILVFVRCFIRDWTRALAWSAVVMAGSIALRMTSMLVAVNSLLGVRSALPTLLPIVICLPVRRLWRVDRDRGHDWRSTQSSIDGDGAGPGGDPGNCRGDGDRRARPSRPCGIRRADRAARRASRSAAAVFMWITHRARRCRRDARRDRLQPQTRADGPVLVLRIAAKPSSRTGQPSRRRSSSFREFPSRC